MALMMPMVRFGTSFVLGLVGLERDEDAKVVQQVQNKLGKGLTRFQGKTIGVGYGETDRFMQIDTGKGRQPIDDEVDTFLRSVKETYPKIYYGRADDADNKGELIQLADGEPTSPWYYVLNDKDGDELGVNQFATQDGELKESFKMDDHFKQLTKRRFLVSVHD